MDKVEDILILERELENLREKLNKDAVKNIGHISKEKYKDLLAISTQLDDVIVNYIKSSNR